MYRPLLTLFVCLFVGGYAAGPAPTEEVATSFDGLACEQSAPGAARLDWSNPQPYVSIVITRDGEDLTVLPGDAVEFVDDAAPAGRRTYGLRAVNEGSLSGPEETCEVEVRPGGVANLTCEGDGAEVSLHWDNAVSYDSIEVHRDGALVQEMVGSSVAWTDPDPDPDPAKGGHTYAIVGVVDGVPAEPVECLFAVDGVRFVRGDIDADGTINITDPIVLLHYLFQSGTEPGCLDAADVDATGDLLVVDALYLLSYLFVRGPEPPAPFLACDLNPQPGTGLGCEAFAPCAVGPTAEDEEPADDPPDGNDGEDGGGEDPFFYDPGGWFDNDWGWDPWDWGWGGV